MQPESYYCRTSMLISCSKSSFGFPTSKTKLHGKINRAAINTYSTSLSRAVCVAARSCSVTHLWVNPAHYPLIWNKWAELLGSKNCRSHDKEDDSVRWEPAHKERYKMRSFISISGCYICRHCSYLNEGLSEINAHNPRNCLFFFLAQSSRRNFCEI